MTTTVVRTAWRSTGESARSWSRSVCQASAGRSQGRERARGVWVSTCPRVAGSTASITSRRSTPRRTAGSERVAPSCAPRNSVAIPGGWRWAGPGEGQGLGAHPDHQVLQHLRLVEPQVPAGEQREVELAVRFRLELLHPDEQARGDYEAACQHAVARGDLTQIALHRRRALPGTQQLHPQLAQHPGQLADPQPVRRHRPRHGHRRGGRAPRPALPPRRDTVRDGVGHGDPLLLAHRVAPLVPMVHQRPTDTGEDWR